MGRAPMDLYDPPRNPRFHTHIQLAPGEPLPRLTVLTQHGKSTRIINRGDGLYDIELWAFMSQTKRLSYATLIEGCEWAAVEGWPALTIEQAWSLS